MEMWPFLPCYTQMLDVQAPNIHAMGRVEIWIGAEVVLQIKEV